MYNKYFITVLVLLFLLVPSISNGSGSRHEIEKLQSSTTSANQETEISTIDFPNTSKIVVELESCQVLKEKLKIYKETTVELSKQVNLAREEASLEKQKFEEAKAQLESNEELYKQKIDILQKDLDEASKPRWKAMFESFGLGALSATILIVVLL
jgi:hypothetical protein